MISTWGATGGLKPAMSLNLLSGAISSLVTFSRSTVATVTDFEGVIKNTKINEARFDGMRRVENLLAYSQAIGGTTGWSNNATTSTVNNVSAPDGTTTASKLTEDATTNSHYVGTTTLNTIISGQTYNFSIYLKKGTGATAPQYVQFNAYTSSFNCGIVIDLNAGTIYSTLYIGGATVSSSSVNSIGKGWYKYTFTTKAIANSGAANAPAIVFINNNPALAIGSGSPSYLGATTSDVYCWGAMVENVTGQTNQNPSEYVSTNVLSYPYQGAGVDGVQYFNYTNPNCAINGVLTQIPTTPINSSNSKWAYNCTTAGDYFSTPSSTANRITGDLSLLAQVALDDWTPTTVQCLIVKDGVSAGTRSWAFNVQASGVLRLNVSFNGTALFSYDSTVATGFTDRTVHYVGVQRESSTGIIRFYTSEDGRTFTQLGADVAGTAGALYDATTQPVQFGNLSGLSFALDGKIYDSHVYSGLKFTGTSTMVMDFDPSNWTVGQGNLLTYSQDFSNAVWTKTNATITTAANVAPDGTLTATLLIESATTAIHYMARSAVTAGVSNGTSYTYSLYFKYAGRQYFVLDLSDALTGGCYIYVDALNGVITQSVAKTGSWTTVGSSISAVGNGWYRASVTGILGANNALSPIVWLSSTSTGGENSSYTGDGYSGIYIWGAQLTQTSTAVPYLPTTSVAIPSGFLGLETGEVWTLNGNAKIYQGLWDATGPSSLLIEEQRINVFLNSTAPATQSYTTSATPYTLSFYGSGTITLSGSYVAVVAGIDAYTRKTLTFTPTAASLVMTLTGTITSPQLEAGSFATSPIVTAGAQVTRTADQASMTGTNFSSWYNTNASSIYWEGDVIDISSQVKALYALSDNTITNRIDAYEASGTINFDVYGTGKSSVTANTKFKVGQSLSATTVLTALNGSVSSTANTMPSGLNRLNLGSNYTLGTNPMSGHVRQFNVYSTALPTAVLTSLTS